MTNFYLQSRDAEGFAPSNDLGKTLSGDLGNPGSITIPVANNATEASFAICNRNVPANALWEAGTTTVKIRVTTADADMHLAVQAVRMNSAGVAQENTSNSPEQTLSSAGVYTFTIPTKTWGAGACDDRFLIWYYFRSSNAHGGAISVIIETGTVDSIVTTPITRNSGVCYGVFQTDLAQFRNDHKTALPEGGDSLSDGVLNNMYLDGRVASNEWRENIERITAKAEVKPVGTAFTDIANYTNAQEIQLNPESPTIRRSHAIAYDSLRKRLILCGGLEGSNQFNDLWELQLGDLHSPQPQWRKLAPTGTPMSARRTHIMEYDATNDRLIVGYGYDGADKGDLFEIDFSSDENGAWATLSATGTAPSARAQASSCIDNVNAKFYVVCGWGASRYNDVNVLDLTSGSEAWTELDDGSGFAPSTRNDPATAFAPAWSAGNDGIYIFGGYNGTVRLNDSWLFSLTSNSWSTLSETGTPPSTRELASIVYDPNHDRMVIFGGRNGTGASDVREDIFQIAKSGYTWTDLTQSDGMPAGVWGASAIYDPLHKLMITFGGHDSSLYDTKHLLAFDLTSDDVAPARQLYLNNGLRGRDAMAYAYNPDRRETMMMGGYARPYAGDLFNGEHTTEIWIYDHANDEWYNALRDILGMPNREGVTAVYDTLRNRFVIFGGLTGNNTNNNTYYNDTWALEWSEDAQAYVLTKLATTGTKPTGRWLHAAIYDETNDRMVIFGGDDGASYKNDVHELDFSSDINGAWLAMSPTGTAPSARRQPTYIYDPVNGRMVITHGATGTSSFVGDTFALDLSTQNGAWSTMSPSGSGPSNRRGMTGVYASDKQYMMCFGGYSGSVLDGTYGLNVATPNGTWITFAPATVPGARRSHIAGYDVTTKKMMIFGGRDTAASSESFITRNNTYIYDTSDGSSSNWDWAFTVPRNFVNTSIKITGLTASENYHWQSWSTGVDSGDAEKVSAFANLESATDFTTGAGGGTPDNDARSAEIDGEQSSNDARSAEVTGSLEVNDARSAEIDGVESASDARGAEVAGEVLITNARSAEVVGAESANDARGAEIDGAITTNDARSAEVHGAITLNDARSASIEGVVPVAVNSTREASIAGFQPLDDERGASIDGVAPINTNDARSAEIDGVDSTSEARSAEIDGALSTDDARSAEVDGEQATDDARSASIEGSNPINTNDARSAEVDGELGTNDARSAVVTGSQESDDARSAEVHGAVTLNDARSASIEGVNPVAVNDARSAEVDGEQSSNDARSAEIDGVALDNDARSAEIDGVEGANDARSAEVTGSLEVNDARSAEIDGAQSVQEARSAEIDGAQGANDERGAIIDGESSTSDSRSAEIEGVTDTETNDARSAEIDGEQSSNDARSAEIDGAQGASEARSAEVAGEVLITDARSAEVVGAENVNDARAVEIDGALGANDSRGASIDGDGVAGTLKIKVGGAFVTPVTKFKTGGTFVTKTMKVKAGGVWK